MEVILVEKVRNLGDIGAVVKVRDGFARNFLIPQGKAIRATKENLGFYEERQASIRAENKKKYEQAEKLVAKLPESVTILRQAAEDTRLFGSVNSRDIANSVEEVSGISVARTSIILSQVIKYIGIYEVEVILHPEVSKTVLVNVARSENEAAQALASRGNNNNKEAAN